jgi:hypothetical protein
MSAPRPTKLQSAATLELSQCPECGSAAEIVDRFVVESTDGPVEEVKLRCIERHWFLLPVAYLDRPTPEGL